MTDPLLDTLTAVLGAATVLMAGATIYLGRQTRDSVRVGAKVAQAAQAEADATVALVNEARRDRELAVQPVLLIEQSGDLDNGIPILQLRNIGRGPAIGVRAVQRNAGEVFWNVEPFHIASDASYPARGGCFSLEGRRGAGSVEPALVGEAHTDDLYAYCFDQLGNSLRFRLRRSDPPTVWRPGEPRPDWAAALDQPLDWRNADLRRNSSAD
jgi:hypothetical protein